MERRGFIKSSCNICLLMAAGAIFPSLSACSGNKTIQADVIDEAILLPLALFSQANIQVVRPRGWYYDIAVTKRGDGTYQALLLQCTHQANQLTHNGSGYTCTLHGSWFDKDGQVTKGPAARSLLQYKTSLDNNQLIIHLKT